MANMAKIDEVMAIIEKEHAKSLKGEFCAWDQEIWAHRTQCGTAFCFAGWRAHLDGKIKWDDRVSLSCAINEDAIDSYAAEAFELDWTDADVLFASGNTIEDLRAMVEHLREHGTLESYDQC